jgi:acyl-CoA thioester hydrolase
MHEKHIEIRWRDMDAFGHVNNAVYLTYLEEVRDEWMERVVGRVGDVWDFVLARVAIDYRRPLAQSDDEVMARVRLVNVGSSSIRTREEILTAHGEVVAEAESIMVARDRATGRSHPLTAAERSALQAELS